MKTYPQMREEMLKDPDVRAEVERLEREEMPMLDAILKARKASKMSQKDIAEKMGVAPPVVSRLENALITGKHSPSIATLKRYAEAMGKRVEIKFV